MQLRQWPHLAIKVSWYCILYWVGKKEHWDMKVLSCCKSLHQAVWRKLVAFVCDSKRTSWLCDCARAHWFFCTLSGCSPVIRSGAINNQSKNEPWWHTCSSKDAPLILKPFLPPPPWSHRLVTDSERLRLGDYTVESRVGGGARRPAREVMKALDATTVVHTGC